LKESPALAGLFCDPFPLPLPNLWAEAALAINTETPQIDPAAE
jgi:hypothetical protein